MGALALAAVLIANSSEWATSTVYFGLASIPMVLGVLFLTAAAVWGAGTRILPATPSRCAAFLICLTLWWAYRILGPVTGLSTLGTAWQWGVVVTLGGLAWLAARRGNAEFVGRLAMALIVASILFVVVPPAKGFAMALPDAEAFRLRWLSAVPQARNTVVVLFDEMSPEVTEPLVADVRRGLAYVQSTTIASVGRNTVNVIPAMLTSRRFDSFEPCGQAVLCSSKWALDMGRLNAPPGQVDVIGFHMPYCHIAGLRSCSMVAWGNLDALRLEKALLCNLLAELGCEQAVAALKRWAAPATTAAQVGRTPSNTRPVIDWRARLAKQLDGAPFWERGGLLYIHLPLPHPPASMPSKSLANDYRSNMLDAEVVTRDIIQRLQASFDQQFLLVITSDHPLRTDMYCKGLQYRSDNCAVGLPANRGQVPLIIASPQTIPFIGLEDNLGLLQ